MIFTEVNYFIWGSNLSGNHLFKNATEKNGFQCLLSKDLIHAQMSKSAYLKIFIRVDVDSRAPSGSNVLVILKPEGKRE